MTQVFVGLISEEFLDESIAYGKIGLARYRHERMIPPYLTFS